MPKRTTSNKTSKLEYQRRLDYVAQCISQSMKPVEIWKSYPINGFNVSKRQFECDHKKVIAEFTEQYIAEREDIASLAAKRKAQMMDVFYTAQQNGKPELMLKVLVELNKMDGLTDTKKVEVNLHDNRQLHTNVDLSSLDDDTLRKLIAAGNTTSTRPLSLPEAQIEDVNYEEE